MKMIFYFLLLLIMLPSCDIHEREQALQKKEAELNQKEQELLVKEKGLQLKEEELVLREKKLDSNIVDSSSVYNPTLIGLWDVKMVATETTCPGSAVGDTRNEQWQIEYQNNHLVARAMAGANLVRIYTGIYTGNTLELVEVTEGASAQTTAKMVVRLRLITPTTMEGQREIIRPDCKIIYSIQMTKQQ